jgi:hypothetical protein
MYRRCRRSKTAAACASPPPDATIPGLAVSPDGRSLLVAQYDQNGSNIIMVERAR